MNQQSGSLLTAATEYGITAASGAFAGGSNGLILGATNIDESKTVEENVTDIVNTTALSAATGASAAVTFKVGFKLADAGVRSAVEATRIKETLGLGWGPDPHGKYRLDQNLVPVWTPVDPMNYELTPRRMEWYRTRMGEDR